MYVFLVQTVVILILIYSYEQFQEFSAAHLDPFCDVTVNVPCNVRIVPLDVHQYVNCDVLKMELIGSNGGDELIKHEQFENRVNIFWGSQQCDRNVTCNIEVPVKASIDVSAIGNISAGFFNGSKIILRSLNGSISVEKYSGNKIELGTKVGDINLQGPIIAADIKAIVSQSGSIRTKRLQAICAALETSLGDIKIESSYCDDGSFKTNDGNLDLQSMHKNSKIRACNGNVTLSLDGGLDATLSNTNAEIQISRVTSDSSIVMKQDGELKLHLSDECQQNTLFQIQSKSHMLDPNINLIPSRTEDTLYLTPMNDKYNVLRVQSDGPVHIRSATWVNMLKLNVKK